MRGRKGERERNIHAQETHQSVASHTPPAGDLAHNPDMCPDWELNWKPLGSQVGTQSTEPHQPEQKLKKILKIGKKHIKYKPAKINNGSSLWLKFNFIVVNIRIWDWEWGRERKVQLRPHLISQVQRTSPCLLSNIDVLPIRAYIIVVS